MIENVLSKIYTEGTLVSKSRNELKQFILSFILDQIAKFITKLLHFL